MEILAQGTCSIVYTPRVSYIYYMRRRWIIALGIFIALTGGITITLSRGSDKSTFPQEISTKASKFMTIYYYNNSTPPDDFTLIPESVTFSGGLLTFQLENRKSQKVTFTEQSLPKELASSKVESGDKVEGAPGSATVTFKEGRAIGTLLSNDKQTMVVANSTDSIGTSTMKDLIRHLTPLKN